ncbi:MAG: PQQ-binding-like beta-propeller repeat protein [Melioribacteraceae bacterium]|nr:PQQ-binding-like beta-propeller repeat protein [Melioribacteraceae bacterium]
MRKLLIIILLIILNSCGGWIKIKKIPTDSRDNLMYGNTPQRDFYIPIEISDSLEFSWEADTKGSHAHTAVTTVSRFLFIGDLAGRLICYNRITGKKVGELKNDGDISIAPAIGKYRLVYVVNEFKEKYSTVVFYDYIVGKIRHEIELPGKFVNELIIENEFVYLLSEEGKLYKYNMKGEQEWMYDAKCLTISIPAVYKEQILFNNAKGEIIAVEKNFGKELYRKKITKSFESGISVSDEKAFLGDTEGFLFCFDCEKRDIEWKFDTGSKIRSLAVFDNTNIFVGNLNGDFFSVSKTDGKLNWKTETGGLLNTPALVFKNLVVVPDQDQKVYFINKEDGVITNSIEFGKRVKLAPVYSDNTLFFGADRGIIYAYKIIMN